MASKTQFLGFKKVLTGTSMQDNYLYFQRPNTDATEGKIWFNNVCYGSCRDTDVNKLLEALDGFLTGATPTDVKQYIDDAIAHATGALDSSESGQSADGHVSVQVDIKDGELTAVTVNTNDIASASALTEEISARTDADTAMQAEIDAIETAVGLASGGTYVHGDGKFTSGATSVADAIDKLDDALASAVTDIETEIETKINELDADESGASTYVNVRVQEEGGVITDVSVDDSALEEAIEAMALAEVHEAGKAIIAVSEEDGKVSASAGTIAAQYVDVADADNHFTATNVETALAELWSGYTQGDAALLGDATESGNTLGKLEDRIEELSADAKEYHLVKVEDDLPAEIKERYYLADAEGNQSGATIDVPKDSHIVSITYITASGDPHYQNLEYVYIDVCGATKTEYVDMSALVLEQEFASGVGITNHVAHGVVDPTSEAFLTVGADGFKLSGVQDAIDEAIEDANEDIMSALTQTAATLSDMISSEESDREDADAAIQAELDAVESSLGFNNTAYTNNGTYISGITVADDIKKLDTALGEANMEIASLQDALENLDSTKEDTSEDGHVTVEVEEKDGLITAVTVTTSDIASASATSNALEEVDGRLDAIEAAYVTGVTVNDVDATVANNHATVTIDAGDVELGAPLTGTQISESATTSVYDTLQDIIDNLDRAVEFVKEEATVTTAENGHLELAQNDNNEWYAQMFWINEEETE